jgi:hypothetical protein
MTTKHFLGLLGFAFVAAWIAFNFGYALLCLAGAGAFYALAGVLEGEIDLGEVQQRLRSSSAQREPAGPAPRTGRVR